jgi:hypothetical protein
MANRIFGAIGLIGGSTGSLDSINGSDVNDKDMAVVMDQTNVRFYVLDDDASGAEDAVNYTIINPDTNAGTKSWILQSIAVNDISYVQDDLTVTDDASIGGDLDITGALTFDGAGAAVTGFSGADVTSITGTAGTSGDFAIWNADGDIVDGPSPGDYVTHALATAANDFLVASGSGAFVKKTLAETGAILEADLDHGNLQGLSTGADHSYIDQSVVSGASPTFTGTNITAVASITAADESTDTTCFPLFATAATGTVAAKTATGLTFNASTDALAATLLDSPAIGSVAAGTIVGTTIDATTDFTVGTTVITSGVITDATLSLAGDVDCTGAHSATTYDADTDFTVGDTVITTGGITHAGTFSVVPTTKMEVVGSGKLEVGTADTVYGHIKLHGHAAATTQGGLLELYTAADYDTTIDYYAVDVDEDDLLIGPDTDPNALEYRGENNRWYFNSGDVRVGVTDTVRGNLTLEGAATSSTDGGIISVALAADHDGTINTYQIQGYEDDLYIGPNTDTDALIYYGATDTWQSTVAFDVDAACTATTFDADTDFTVGSTVITDGVITDATGLSIAATTDFNSNASTNVNIDSGDVATGVTLNIIDSAGWFAGTEVETILAEVGQELSVHVLNGFEDASTVALSTNSGTPPTITLTFTGTVAWWTDGIRYTATGTDNIVLTDSNGLHWLYYDGSTLTEAVNPSDAALDTIIINKALVALVYWETNTNTAVVLADEMHGVIMSGETHHWLHDTQGTQYRSGGGISGYTLETATDAALSFDLTNLQIYDEDIVIDIIDGLASTQYSQVLTGDAEIPVLYHDDISGAWIEQAASTLPYLVGGTPRLQYQNDDGDSTWSLVEVSNGYYMNYWLVATNDWQYPIKMIPGTTEYQTKALALTGSETEIAELGNFPAKETLVLYRFLMHDSSGGSTDAEIIDIVDYRFLNISAAQATAAAADHGALAGLNDDDHTQYIRHNLVTATSDFLVASGSGVVVKKTLAETGAILEADLDHGNLQGLSTGADHSYIDQSVVSGSSPTFDGTNITGVASIDIADESADTTCFPLFATAATGAVAPKSGTNLTFNSATGLLTATTLAGANTSWDAASAHVSADGSSHSAVGLNTTHRTSTGADHSYLDQAVTVAGTPTFATVDASTDFTVGATVITNGVITDATGLQLAANIDITGNADINGALTFDGAGAAITAFQTTISDIDTAVPTSGAVVDYAGSAVGASHTRSHTITGTSDHTAGNWKVLYTNGSGQVVELALPADGQVLTSTGAGTAPQWEAPSAVGIEDDVYGAGWNGDTTNAPSQNAVYDKINAMDSTISTNTTHISSNGTDHSYIDQDVTSGSSPTLTGTNISAVASVTAADESADTTCFPLFVTAATGTVAPKTGTNLTFNSATGGLLATTVDATTDFTVGGTVFTDAKILDDAHMQIGGATGVDLLVNSTEIALRASANGSCVLYYDNGQSAATTTNGMDFGTAGGNYGLINLHGQATGSTNGGLIRFNTADDHDSNIAYYQIWATSDDFTIGTTSNTDALKFIGAGTDCTIQSTVAFDVDAALTATTVDADTDFTVGGTVITNNTITDDGTLSIVTATATTITDSGAPGSNAVLNLGTTDSIAGIMYLFADNDQSGPWINFQVPPDNDGNSTTSFTIQVNDNSDDFWIGPNNDENMLVFRGGATPTLSITSGWDATGTTCSNLGSVSTVDINGGTIDSAAIGGGTPAAGAFTTLSASSVISANGGVTYGDADKQTWDTLPASDDTCSGEISSETVDTNSVGIGAILYLASDGNWDMADADAAATCGLLGMAVESGTGTKNVMHQGWIHLAAHGFTVGAPLFVSTTAGTMTNTQPSGDTDIVQVCGYATSANVIRFNPSPDYLEVTV